MTQLILILLTLTQAGPLVEDLLAQQGNWVTHELCECVPVTVMFDYQAGVYVIAGKSGGNVGFNAIPGTMSHWRKQSYGEWMKIIDSSNYWTFANVKQNFTARTSSRLLYAMSNGIWESIDSGRTWVLQSGGTGVMGIHMFTSDSGYKALWNSADSTLTVRLTYGDVTGFFDDVYKVTLPQNFKPGDVSMRGRDTLLMLSRLVRITTDRGQSWQVIDPTGGENPEASRRFLRIVRTSDPSRFYLLSGIYRVSDYFSTTDFGKSWTHHTGRFRQRLARLAESGENLLFGIAMDSTEMDAADNLLSNFGSIGRRSSGDTLVYTTDQGRTWSVETRFLGDTLTHLLAGDSGRVYLVHYRGGKTFVSTYIPGIASVEGARASTSSLRVFPNPSSTSLNFTLPVDASLRITLIDPLGRKLHEAEIEHDNAKPSTLDYPSTLAHYNGPLLLIADGGWFKTSQLIVKY